MALLVISNISFLNHIFGYIWCIFYYKPHDLAVPRFKSYAETLK